MATERRILIAAALVVAGLSLAAAPKFAATDTNTVRTVPIQPPEAPVDEQQQEDGSNLADIGNLPEVSKDISQLPEAVQRMRAEILDAARSGDISRMQVPIDQSELPPAMGQNNETDIVSFLRSLAGDENGREILAIIVEILESGYAHVEPGTDREAYVWPYFAALPFDALTPEQEVDLFKVITAADRDDMASHAGQYTFYRLGIGPDGTWYFLLSGD